MLCDDMLRCIRQRAESDQFHVSLNGPQNAKSILDSTGAIPEILDVKLPTQSNAKTQGYGVPVKLGLLFGNYPSKSRYGFLCDRMLLQ